MVSRQKSKKDKKTVSSGRKSAWDTGKSRERESQEERGDFIELEEASEERGRLALQKERLLRKSRGAEESLKRLELIRRRQKMKEIGDIARTSFNQQH